MKAKYTLFLFLIISYSNLIEANNYNDSSELVTNFLSQIQVKQGVVSFSQKKHFTFLTKPIVSKGLLKIHQKNMIWQVEKPVSSKLIIINNQVWHLIERSNGITTNKYREIASKTSIENIIRALFTGQIQTSQWSKNVDEMKCLQLKPRALYLSKIITQIQMCLSDKSNHKYVTIIDSQKNLTEFDFITLTPQLTSEERREFNIN